MAASLRSVDIQRSISLHKVHKLNNFLMMIMSIKLQTLNISSSKVHHEEIQRMWRNLCTQAMHSKSCDLWGPSRTGLKTRDDSAMEISAWFQKHIWKSLSNNTVSFVIHKCRLSSVMKRRGRIWTWSRNWAMYEHGPSLSLGQGLFKMKGKKNTVVLKPCPPE